MIGIFSVVMQNRSRCQGSTASAYYCFAGLETETSKPRESRSITNLVDLAPAKNEGPEGKDEPTWMLTAQKS